MKEKYDNDLQTLLWSIVVCKFLQEVNVQKKIFLTSLLLDEL